MALLPPPGLASLAPRPPPGLEDALLPAKVQLAGKMAGGTEFAKVDPLHMPVSTNKPGEWLDAVLASAPHLDSKGLKHALNILDCATENMQKAKALESCMSGMRSHDICGGSPTVSHSAVADVWRMQVCFERSMLLQQLQALVNTPPRQLPLSAAPQPGLPNPLAATKPKTKQRHGGQKCDTLSTSLQLLANEDAECLLIVRRINKLGFKASGKLKQHFSSYGTVVRVLVAHSTVKQQGEARRRPSCLGFVHMASAGAVGQILALGSEQEVDGASIRVQRFERQSIQAAAEGDEDCGNFDAEGLIQIGSQQWQRQTSSASTTATSQSRCFESEDDHSDVPKQRLGI